MRIPCLSRNNTSSLIHRKHCKSLLTLVPTVLHILKDFDFRLIVHFICQWHFLKPYLFSFFKWYIWSLLWFLYVFDTLFVHFLNHIPFFFNGIYDPSFDFYMYSIHYFVHLCHCLETYTRWLISFGHALLNLETYTCFSGTYSSVIFFSWFFC